MCNFWSQSRVENFLGVKLCFEKLLFSIVLSSYIYGFCFINFALFLHYHVVLSSCGWVVVGGSGGVPNFFFVFNPATVMVVVLYKNPIM